METSKEEDLLKQIALSNDPQYNLLKTVEELLELGEKLQKKALKVDYSAAPTDDEIIEEIGDVQIRLWMLRYVFDTGKVDARISYKLAKYEEYLEQGKYIGKI